MLTQSLKAGDLKALVIKILHNRGPMTVNLVNDIIFREYNRTYAYTTIATILSRLEKDGTIQSETKKVNKRKTKIFSLKSGACTEEVQCFISSLFNKFGSSGLECLGQFLNLKLSDDDLKQISKKIS